MSYEMVVGWGERCGVEGIMVRERRVEGRSGGRGIEMTHLQSGCQTY